MTSATNERPAADWMAMAKRVHEMEWPTRSAAAQELGVPLHQLYNWLRVYREDNGIAPSAHQMAKKGRGRYTSDIIPGEDPMTRKRRLDAARKREKNAELRALRLNGGSPPKSKPQPLVRVSEPADHELQARVHQLAADLEAAHEEIRTLQKLLMVVGRTL